MMRPEGDGGQQRCGVISVRHGAGCRTRSALIAQGGVRVSPAWTIAPPREGEDKCRMSASETPGANPHRWNPFLARVSENPAGR